MNAMRAAVLPRCSAENAENHPPLRPKLRVAYRAESPLPAVSPPAASVSAAPVPVRPLTSVPAPARPLSAAPAPAPVPALARPRPTRPLPALAPARVAPTGLVSARPAPAGESATSPLRLTRRGRVVIAVMAALLVAVVSLIAASAAQATSHSAPRLGARNLARVVVRPGQSLWSVAESADPGADTRLVIQQILELNALTGDTVFAGQSLWVPRS
jgi:LysM repeat protein